MFFVLSKVLAMLLFPYSLFLLVAVCVAWRMPRSRLRLLFRLALFFLVALSINWGATLLVRPLENRFPAVPGSQIPRADAIVVLSGMINVAADRGRPEFLSSVDRILYAEQLWHEGRAPHLLISGGSGLLLQKGNSEAEVLGVWLRGVRRLPAGAVMTEPASRNTHENALATARIAKERGWKKVHLVTSAFHMPRSVACFRKVGLEVVPLPVDYYTFTTPPGPEAFVPTPGALALSTMAIKEYLGLIAYYLRGYI